MKVLYLITILLTTSCSPIKNLYVLYADEAKAEITESKNIKIYLDRKGLVYPNLKTNNKNLRSSYKNQGLESYYSENIKKLDTLLINNSPTYTPKLSLKNKIQLLQNALIKQKIALINNNSTPNTTITFLVHGYNNSHTSVHTSYTNAKRKLQHVKNNIFVEVFWDGLYQKPKGLDKKLTFLNPLKIWNNAQAASYNVGIELRRIITPLKVSKVVFLAHSTGANVISSALFNQITKTQKCKTDGFYESYLNKLGKPEYKTPSQNSISVFYIAPAMPGVSTFADYYKRQTSLDFTKNDNYKLYVTTNRNDFALNKRWNCKIKKEGRVKIFLE